MTIYVDTLAHRGWRLRGREVASCHLFTDCVELEGLHYFAARVGMQRQWFQPHHIAPHYDLTKSRRDAALSLGALAVERRVASRIWLARRELTAHQEGIRLVKARRAPPEAAVASALPHNELDDDRVLAWSGLASVPRHKTAVASLVQLPVK